MSEVITAQKLFDACRLLFGNEAEYSMDFLHYLKESGLKSAYRKKARETHPDLAAILNCDARYLESQFKRINDAYHYLLTYIQNPGRLVIIDTKSSYKAQRANPQYRFREDKVTRMPLGRYLYYRGLITYRDLIDALVWQKSKRPVIGELARRMRFLTDDEVKEILKRRRWGERFGESARRLGFLTSYEVERILARQRLIQPRIGRYFIEKGILTPSEIERLAWDLRQFNIRRKANGGFSFYP